MKNHILFHVMCYSLKTPSICSTYLCIEELESLFVSCKYLKTFFFYPDVFHGTYVFIFIHDE